MRHPKFRGRLTQSPTGRRNAVDVSSPSMGLAHGIDQARVGSDGTAVSRSCCAGSLASRSPRPGPGQSLRGRCAHRWPRERGGGAGGCRARSRRRKWLCCGHLRQRCRARGRGAGPFGSPRSKSPAQTRLRTGFARAAAAEADAALIDGHFVFGACFRHVFAAEADAALIDGHLRREPCITTRSRRGGRRGLDRWTLSVALNVGKLLSRGGRRGLDRWTPHGHAP